MGWIFLDFTRNFFLMIYVLQNTFSHDSHTSHHPFSGDVSFSTAVLCIHLLWLLRFYCKFISKSYSALGSILLFFQACCHQLRVQQFKHITLKELRERMRQWKGRHRYHVYLFLIFQHFAYIYNIQSSVSVCHLDILPVVKWHIKQFNYQYKPVINLLTVWQLTMKMTRNGESPQ